MRVWCSLWTEAPVAARPLSLEVSGASSRFRSSRLARRRLSLYLVGVFVGLSAFAVVVPLLPNALAWGPILVMAGLFFLFIMARRVHGRLDIFEIFIPFTVLYIFYFGIGTLYLLKHPEKLASLSLLPYLVPAAYLGTLGYFCFFAGYALLGRNVAPSPAAGLVPSGPLPVLLLAGIGFVGFVSGALSGRIIGAGGGVSPLLSTFQQFGVVYFLAWSLAWYLYFTGGFSKGRSIATLAALGGLTIVIVFLTFGGKSLTLKLLGIPAISFWYARSRIPWRSLAAVTLIGIFVVFPLYNTYRTQKQTFDMEERLYRTVRTMQRWGWEEYYGSSVDLFLARMAGVSSAAAVLRDAGRWVEFRYGDTLLLAPVSLFIPRLFWPEKPLITRGREFAETFHLVSYSDRTTQVAPTAVGELYWNFHVPGVVLGMFFLGGLYRWFYKRYGDPLERPDPLRRALYVSLLVGAMEFEGNLSPLIAGFAKTLLLSAAAFWGLRRLGLLRSWAVEGNSLSLRAGPTAVGKSLAGEPATRARG
jgi:hypothetical protein